MGKPTGFMEYERKDNAAIEPLERIKNFNGFHAPMREKTAKETGTLYELWSAVLPVGHDDRWNGLRMPSE